MERYIKEIKNNPLMVTIKFARYKFIAKMLSKDDSVLEVGCNDGVSTNFFSKYCNKIVGIDIDDEKITEAKKHFPKITFIKEDALKYKPENNFDVVVMLDFIEHFSKEDGDFLIKKYLDCLSSKGMMLVGTPNKYFYKYRSERSKAIHIHEYYPEELKELLEKYFNRVLLFSMNDEIVHTGNLNLAWFIFALGYYPQKIKITNN